MTLEHGIEPIVGWRVWNIRLAQDGPVLLPAGSGSDAWPRRRPLEARCTVPRVLTGRRTRHQAPDAACRCGIHASATLDIVTREWPAWPSPPVVGRVSLWGRTVAHERGWRARFAYPTRLRMVCIVCAWIQPGPGDPSVVHEFAEHLYTLCAAHEGGIEVPDGRRTRPAGIDPATLQARLLDAYAVELLPAEPLEPLYRRPAAPEMPGYFPSVRLVRADGGGRRP